jgi:hypothetical protein
MVPATQNFVSNFTAWRNISNNNLLTLNNHHAANCSGIVGCA